MNKVIFSAATALTLAVVFTGAASATYYGSQYGCGGYRQKPCQPEQSMEIEVENEDTFVKTEAEAKADTGDNVQVGTGGGQSMPKMFSFHSMGGSKTPSQKMVTGDAWALSDAYSNVNSTYLPGCDCFVRRGTSELSIENEDTKVITEAEARADSGDNEQIIGGSEQVKPSRRGSHSSTGGVNQYLRTGDAAAEGYAQAWVNMTNMRVYPVAN